MKKIIYLAVTCVLILGITIALGQSKRGKGGNSRVTLYGSNGFVIMEWTTPYEVEYDNGQFSFIEAKTDHRIRVSGTVVVDSAP